MPIVAEKIKKLRNQPRPLELSSKRVVSIENTSPQEVKELID